MVNVLARKFSDRVSLAKDRKANIALIVKPVHGNFVQLLRPENPGWLVWSVVSGVKRMETNAACLRLGVGDNAVQPQIDKRHDPQRVRVSLAYSLNEQHDAVDAPENRHGIYGQRQPQVAFSEVVIDREPPVAVNGSTKRAGNATHRKKAEWHEDGHQQPNRKSAILAVDEMKGKMQDEQHDRDGSTKRVVDKRGHKDASRDAIRRHLGNQCRVSQACFKNLHPKTSFAPYYLGYPLRHWRLSMSTTLSQQNESRNCQF